MLCIAMQVNSSQCEIPPTVIPKNVKERNEVQLSKIISVKNLCQLLFGTFQLFNIADQIDTTTKEIK